MAGYGWTTYDPRRGGVHVINDSVNSIDMVVQYAKLTDYDESEYWGLEVEAIPRPDSAGHQTSTIIFYLGTEDSTSGIHCGMEQNTLSSQMEVVCEGTASSLPDFGIQISSDRLYETALQTLSIKSLQVPQDSIWQAKSIFNKELEDGKQMLQDSPGNGNLHFVQGSFTGHYKFNVLFSPKLKSTAMTTGRLKGGIDDAISTFNMRLMSVFPPQAPFHEEQHRNLLKYLLSNLLGGIGYFHGKSKVASSSTSEHAQTTDVEDKGPYQLFSSVPSRPFFPRGFLWDEGFHLQVILDWDMDLALEIISSWLDTMDENGWIAREQILGYEVRSKVPQEFQTQYPDYANPPTLFLVVQEFVARLEGIVSYKGAPSKHMADLEAGRAFLEKVYPKLKKHYEWFRRTQAGNLTSYHTPAAKFQEGYRWRGRTPQHILTSGLDDYPRAPIPHPEELHVDALSWVGSMAIVLSKITAYLDNEQDQKRYAEHHTEVLRSIDDIHWSESAQAYCDTTVIEGDQVDHICHKGYVSLLPFLVGLVGPNHPHIGAALDIIQDPEHLWSDFGIRSLSRRDEFYGTEENYWRSPIWININYMILQKLLELAQSPGQFQQRAREMYTRLRLNLVTTVFESWKETSFAWEQYNPETGKGQRTQHFTGWTSLIVKIMAMPDLKSEIQPQVPAHINHPSIRFGWRWMTEAFVSGMVYGAMFLLFIRVLRRIWPKLMKKN